jgi:hypothetical protein
MGASLPKGQSAGCLGGISREAKLRGGGGKASLSFLPLNTLAKPAGGGGEAKLPFPLTPWANQQPNPPLPPTFGGGWALPRGLGSEAPHRLRGGGPPSKLPGFTGALLPKGEARGFTGAELPKGGIKGVQGRVQ